MALHLVNVGADRGLVVLDYSLQVLVMLFHLLVVAAALVGGPSLNNGGHDLEDFLSPGPVFKMDTCVAV